MSVFPCSCSMQYQHLEQALLLYDRTGVWIIAIYCAVWIPPISPFLLLLSMLKCKTYLMYWENTKHKWCELQRLDAAFMEHVKCKPSNSEFILISIQTFSSYLIGNVLHQRTKPDRLMMFRETVALSSWALLERPQVVYPNPILRK
jgi:hypothetical protein